jgi:O-antigen ligase
MKLITKNTWLCLGLIALSEIVSLVGEFQPLVSLIGAGLIVLTTAVFAFKNPENGLLVMFAELIVGSKGHLLNLGPVSIRMALFGIVMAAWAYKMLYRQKRVACFKKIKEFPFSRYLALLALFIIWAIINAVLRHNALSNIFSDSNAWFFFLLIFPAIDVYYRAEDKVYNRLLPVITGAFLWLVLETLILLFIFTHNLPFASAVYHWLRTTGIAEITVTVGAWPRIFIQSQIYAALALVALPLLTDWKNKDGWLLLSGAWSVCLLSMSRSFWLATAVVLFIAALALISRFGWHQLWSKVYLIIGSAIVAALLITIITVIPVSGNQKNFSADSFLERASLDSGEAAVASRWSLLPALWHKITLNPIFGSGFGTTVTYKSSDPRVLQSNSSGEYTTYAFEWGYLAFWLKLGLLGLIAYLLLLVKMIAAGWKKWQHRDRLAGALVLGILVLVITHFFTPYLDHPLGIGYLILAAVLLAEPEKQPAKDLP